MSPSTQEKRNHNLELLAATLSSNYLNASLVRSKEDIRSNKIKHIEAVASTELLSRRKTDDFSQSYDYRRIILIVGAGASFNAYQNIPTAKPAIKKIYDQFEVGRDKDDNPITFYDVVMSKNPNKDFTGLSSMRKRYNEIKQSLQLYGSNEDKDLDFETSLALLSYFFPQAEIVDELYSLYKFRHGSSLFMDIISHLFKHRFVDIIVNFNFDELLDQSIQDEIGDNKYISILSDGDCQPMEDLLINQKIKQPIYIKPHGTVSHKSTMRFTKDHYVQLPYDMKNFLADIVTCRNTEGHAQYPVLIVVGFSLSSIEFNDILSKIEKNFVIFYFYYDYKEVEYLEKEYKDKKAQFIPIPIKEFASHDDSYSEYDNVFNLLWKKISSNFIDPFKPRNIKRHKLTHKIFGSKNLEKKLDPEKSGHSQRILNQAYFESIDYYKDRAIVEIWLESLKSYRMMSIRSILKGKPGSYFFKYYTELAKQQDDRKPLSFINFIKTLNLEAAALDDICNIPDEFGLKDLLACKELSPKLLEHLNETSSELKIMLDNYRQEKRSVININYNNRLYSLFDDYKNEQLLGTILAIDYEMLKRLKQDWTHIFVVEDSGVTLERFDEYFKKNTTYLGAILAERSKYYQKPNVKHEEINSSIDADISELSFLKTEEHDHHMTIFANSFTNKLEAIYYYQNGASNTFSPIVVQEKDNLSLLLEILGQYIENDNYEIGHRENAQAKFKTILELSSRIIKKENH